MRALFCYSFFFAYHSIIVREVLAQCLPAQLGGLVGLHDFSRERSRNGNKKYKQ